MAGSTSISIGYDLDRNALYVSGIPQPFPAGSLEARQLGSLLAVASPHQPAGSDLICQWLDFSLWTISGAVYPDAASAFAALTDTCARKRTVGSPQRAYAQPIVNAGDVFPLNPAPVDVNTVALLVNGVAYYPPDTAVSALAVTWQGPFPLDPSDAVRVSYF